MRLAQQAKQQRPYRRCVEFALYFRCASLFQDHEEPAGQIQWDAY